MSGKALSAFIQSLPANFWKALLALLFSALSAYMLIAFRLLAGLGVSIPAVNSSYVFYTAAGISLLFFFSLAVFFVFVARREVKRFKECSKRFVGTAKENAVADFQMFTHLFSDIATIIDNNKVAVKSLHPVSGLLIGEKIEQAKKIIENSINNILSDLAEMVYETTGHRCSVFVKLLLGTNVKVGNEEWAEIFVAYLSRNFTRDIKGTKQNVSQTPFRDIIKRNQRNYCCKNIKKQKEYLDTDFGSLENAKSIVVVEIRHPDQEKILGFLQLDSELGNITAPTSVGYAEEISWRLGVLLARLAALSTHRLMATKLAMWTAADGKLKALPPLSPARSPQIQNRKEGK